MGTYRVLLVDDKIQSLDDAAVQSIHRVLTESVSTTSLGNASCDWDVAIVLAQSGEGAVDELSNANQQGQPFDLILLDLYLPWSHRADPSWEHGLALLDRISPETAHTRIIVFSASADAIEPVRARADAISRARSFDDWITRAWMLDRNDDRHKAAMAKLKRAGVPARWLAEQLGRDSERPLWIRDACMIRVVHSLYLAAQERRPAARPWPLSRILLLGGPGTGKSALADGFHRMLPRRDDRAPVSALNCASLVAEGHGGLIALFGAEAFGSVVNSRGVFVQATSYTGRPATPDYDAGGVAFLDEFVEMAPMLQASVLTSLEDGQVIVEGSRAVRQIGCHIICATNQVPEKLIGQGSGSLRQDLVDRMFRIVEIPPLSKRKNEVVWLLRSMAARHLTTGGESMPADAVMLSDAAQQTLNDALRAGVITSLRQLQAVTRTLGPGETIITDGNLDVIFKKAAMLGVDREDISHEALLRELGLPPVLKWKEMSNEAREAADKLAEMGPITEWSKQSDEVILLLALLDRDTRAKYGNVNSWQKTSESVKARHKLGRNRKNIVAFLTGQWETGQQNKGDSGEAAPRDAEAGS